MGKNEWVESYYKQIIIFVTSMHIIIVLLNLCLLTTSTKLHLSQQGLEQKLRAEVPQMHDHPFSCELIFFHVQNYELIVTVQEIIQNYQKIQLIVGTSQQSVKYRNVKENYNGTVMFFMNLQEYRNQGGIEIIMNFNLVLVGSSVDGNLTEYRKAYILLSQEGEENKIFRLPIKTIAVTTAIGLILTLILPWNIKYKKILPLAYTPLTCSIYIILLVVAIYLQMLFGVTSTIFLIQRIIIGTFQFICLLVYSHDLLMMICDRTLLAAVIASMFSLTIMGLDNFVPSTRDAWFINDIIAVMIAGAFIKFVIVRKMKIALPAFIMMWIFCLFRQFAKQFHIQKFDQGLGIRVLPIFIQFPANWMDNQSSLTCAAFGSSKIISFGLILNFSKRIDLYLSTKMYRTICVALTVFCVGAELVFNIIYQQLPTIQVMSVLLFYPLAITFILFFAKKRGEWAEIWDGSFYDMAVNRQQIRKSTNFEDISMKFGADLIINSSLTGKLNDNNFKQNKLAQD